MVMIRLSRIGKKNHPTYRIVVSDKQKDTQAPYLELLGRYDPHADPSLFEVNKERLLYWISVGAQLSDTLYNLCVTHKLIDGKKRNMMHKAEKTEEEAQAASAPKQQASKETVSDVKKEEKKPDRKAEPEIAQPAEANPKSEKQENKPKA